MKRISASIVSMVLFGLTLGAQDQPKTSIQYVMYRDQAQCDLLARLIPMNASAPCQQMIMVGVKSDDDATTAFRVTLHYRQANGAEQTQSQLVDKNLGGVANAIFLGVENVQILLPVVAEPLASNGSPVTLPK